VHMVVSSLLIEEVCLYGDGRREFPECVLIELSLELYGQNEHVRVVVGEEVSDKFASPGSWLENSAFSLEEVLYSGEKRFPLDFRGKEDSL